MADQYVQVTTMTDSREEADGLARGAVEARLAACGQVLGGVTSTYWWRGEIETAGEWMIVLKTTAARYPALEEFISRRHSYDTPDITAVPLSAGSAAYLAWVSEEARG